jgi:hypothetical protein
VEYIISTGAGTTGSGTTYFLASNDQGTINYNEDATLGLNKGEKGVVAYYIKTGRGNSYWNITEVDYSPEGPAEPEVEDSDVCPAIAAYRIPCGTYSAETRLSQINITGEGALTELNYKPTTTGRYTIYTQERAVLMPGSEITLSANLIGADVEGLTVTIWADFNGDGVFEQSAKPEVAEQLEAKFTIPAVPYQQGRFRIRVDQSGAETPNADFYGTIYDLPISIGAQQTGRVLSVASNDDTRGTVKIENMESTEVNVDFGTEVTVVAEVKEGFFFHGWRQGRTLISSKAAYTTTMTENKNLVAVFATTEGEVIEEDDGTYPVNFPKNTAATRTDRNLNSVSLTVTGKDKQTINLSGNKVYKNQTRKAEQYFHCQPGDELKAEFGYSGAWMHGYVFIDENNDAMFSYTEGDVKQSGTEVKSFSFYSGSFANAESGFNSAGTALSGNARNTMDCPVFKAPETPGLYRIRFKVDWNSVDPGGQLAADGTPTGTNGIIANGGFIVDAILQVEEILLPEEVSISNKGIATFYANMPVSIAEGVKAYVATEIPVLENGEGVISMTEISNIIPAKTGVVICGTEGVYEFEYTSEDGTPVVGNLLHGYAGEAEYAEIAVPEDGSTNYVLALEEEKTGFYKKDTSFRVYNHKAYLNIPQMNNAMQTIRIRLVNTDGTTNIIEIPTTELPKAIYDVSGRRIQQATKGVYIVNGKKVIF